MKKIDSFINQYPLSKTLRFQLIPVGKTEENFNRKLLLEADEKRANDYNIVKGYLDRLYREFINNSLSHIHLEGVKEYSDTYFSAQRDNDSLSKLEIKLRKQIAGFFKDEPQYGDLFKAAAIKNMLPQFLENEEEQHIVSEFYNFTTYFTGFFTNRENMFTDEAKSTGIAFRCINENLPKFLDNICSYKTIKEKLGDQIQKTNTNMEYLYHNISDDIEDIEDLFSVESFSFFLPQQAIEVYNKVLGGFSDENGNKIQGLNEKINLYNQQNGARLPLLKPLFKQILSENESISFIPEKFSSDNELLKAINSIYKEGSESVELAVIGMEKLFSEFELYNMSGIYILNGQATTNLSNGMLGNWNIIQDAWNNEYDSKVMSKKKIEGEIYYEKRKKAYKQIKSFSLEQIQKLSGNTSVSEYYKKSAVDLCYDIYSKYTEATKLLSNEYVNNKKLYRNDNAIALIKNLLDSIKNLEWFVKPLNGTGKEENKDELFYGRFLPLYSSLSVIDKIYDKVRNYLTQKPYSKDKIKLNFENVQLLGGWDRNKESDYRSVILREGNDYFLGILDKSNCKAFMNLSPYEEGQPFMEKMNYKLLPGPNKMLPKVFFAKSNIDYFAPSKEIMDIRKKESFKVGPSFNIADCHKIIDFYKESINKHQEWKEYGFSFSKTESYANIGDFFREVKNQGYALSFFKISKIAVNELINKGELYLFKIYNKDFSEYSKGTPNLHTLYFRMLFDQRNLNNIVFKLNGEAEMFYRKKSINAEEMIIHPAKKAIRNKNPLNSKSESTFEYDIVKDRRFTQRSFMFHLPITMNFQAPGNNYINEQVRVAIRESEDNYIIGIDRGERNLLYICVINDAGEIVEQCSLNEIISEYNNVKHVIDYHKLLDEKEKQRNEARQSWTAVENIKELKEGYLSQVIHKICEMVEKYDAIIAMEDLNSGFKNSRKKVEKQVYQKFEKQLIDKLNFMVNKNKPINEKGGLLKAYQLANNGSQYINRGTQNGFIFYIPAWLTSKIDPITGFVNLLYPKYTSVKDAQDYFRRFKSIHYNSEEDLIEFDLDYTNFPRAESSYRKEWTICSNGERIRTFRNVEKNNEWDNEIIILSDEFKKLFKKFDISVEGEMKDSITRQESKEFFESLIYLLKLTLQMRNSITGRTDVDYIISPVRNNDGVFYDSRLYKIQGKEAKLPVDADANGAYNIARKALSLIRQIKNLPEKEALKKSLIVSNKEWLKFAQDNE